MDNTLIAKFIERSREWNSVTRGRELFEKVAEALQELFNISSGCVVYHKQITLDSPTRLQVYRPWGVFNRVERELQDFLNDEGIDGLMDASVPDTGWQSVKDLQSPFRDIWKDTGLKQMGAWTLVSRRKTTGALLLGTTDTLSGVDTDTLMVTATQIGLILDMLAAWRQAQMSEKRYHSLFQYNMDGMYEVNLHGKVVDLNPAAEEMTGFTLEEMSAMKNPMEMVVPEDQARVLDHILKVFEGSYDVSEFSVLHKDGHTVHMSVHGVPVVIDGIVRGMFEITKDVTLQRTSEELLRNSEKLAVVGQLAAGVAHEIRNPLTALKGFVKLMSESGKTHRYLEIMDSELARIESVTTELLALAKPQAKNNRFINLEDVLAKSVQLLGSQAILKSAQLELHVAEDVPLVVCDVNQMEQVFVNVLKNAIEAVHDGGNIAVRLSYCSSRHNVRIVIQDDGPGIPEEVIPRLGEPFFTTKPKGTGLGLMVSRRILLQYDGHLEIHSKQGAGTKVTITMPIAQDS